MQGISLDKSSHIWKRTLSRILLLQRIFTTELPLYVRRGKVERQVLRHFSLSLRRKDRSVVQYMIQKTLIASFLSSLHILDLSNTHESTASYLSWTTPIILTPVRYRYSK